MKRTIFKLAFISQLQEVLAEEQKLDQQAVQQSEILKQERRLEDVQEITNIEAQDITVDNPDLNKETGDQTDESQSSSPSVPFSDNNSGEMNDQSDSQTVEPTDQNSSQTDSQEPTQEEQSIQDESQETQTPVDSSQPASETSDTTENQEASESTQVPNQSEETTQVPNQSEEQEQAPSNGNQDKLPDETNESQTQTEPQLPPLTPPAENASNPSQELNYSDDVELDEFGNVIVAEIVYTEKELAAMQAFYPSGILFSSEDIKNGASVLFLIGIVYCFFGIQLATQNYINPSVDIIKKKGLMGAELMNVSLLAMTNSLAESFIIVNSIFFGVSDIGISTVVQQAAFYGLINQGMFYLIVAEGTLIDWWIVSRETVFFLLYLAIMSTLLQGNQVELFGAVILLFLYIVHIFLMKYSSKYELVFKKLLAQKMEIKELNRLANNGEMWRFHQNLKTQAFCIEQLNKMDFSVINGYVVFTDTQIKYKLQPIVCVKLGEEQFATQDDKRMLARLRFKRVVAQIIVKIQAYKFNQYILRTQKCKQHIKTLLPHPHADIVAQHRHDETYFGEDYYSEGEEEKEINEELEERDPYTYPDRLERQVPINQHPEFVDEQDTAKQQLLNNVELHQPIQIINTMQTPLRSARSARDDNYGQSSPNLLQQQISPRYQADPTDSVGPALRIKNQRARMQEQDIQQPQPLLEYEDIAGMMKDLNDRMLNIRMEPSEAQVAPFQDQDQANFQTEQNFMTEDQLNVDDPPSGEENNQQWEEYKDHPQPVQLAQSFVYDLLLKNIYKDKRSFLSYPKTTKKRIRYIFAFPHILMQYCTIPNPMAEGKEQFYPLTLIMATIWIYFYSFLIVWWTFAVTMAYDLRFSLLPMILYPFGIMLRDLRKLDDMRVCVKVFKKHCSDQRMGLAETFSGPIFQITGLMGMAWSMYISTSNEPISFINKGIQYQFPLLFATIVVKYILLVFNGYKTSKRLFYVNCGCYLLYCVLIVIIDYWSEITHLIGF